VALNSVQPLSLAIVKINPKVLIGSWTKGYSLDAQVLSSKVAGAYSSGRLRFDTLRTPVGELVYQLKNQGDLTAIEPLADTAANFLQSIWKVQIDAIVPVPPSTSRPIQPVKRVVKALAARLGVPICVGCLTKVKQTPPLKDMTYAEREEALKDAFEVAAELTQGKSLLLFDDIFDWGATAESITEALLNSGQAKKVYLLTLTRTKKNS
jgi:competence protein ComFC